MKLNTLLFFMLFFFSCTYGKESTFTGSTPSNSLIKIFLVIPLSDSIDFIRWKIIFHDETYSLQCNYGVSKPNTNGFINGGKKTELNAAWKKEKNYYILYNAGKTLKMAELNNNLLHFLSQDNSLMVGNGGWSYTLNNIRPLITDKLNITAQPTTLKDSMVFEGRTPCKIPGIVSSEQECYKLKWLVKFYANPERNEPGSFLILGTGWRSSGGKTGNWKMIIGKTGQISYQLFDDEGKVFLHLLKLDERILVFTDAEGKLLTGDEDFSYTLNRRF